MPRVQMEVSTQVGQDNSLTDCLFHRDFSQFTDALDHASSSQLVLAAGESQSVDFGDVTEGRYLYLEADGELAAAVNGVAPTVATLLGAGGTFPTGFVGGEAFSFRVDGVTVSGTFTSGAQTAQQCVNELNARAMLAGLSFVPFQVVGGQVFLHGNNASAAGKVEVLTINALLGFAALVSATGTDADGVTAPIQLARPVDLASGTAVESRVVWLATMRFTALVLTNPSQTDSVRVNVAIAGDLVAD